MRLETLVEKSTSPLKSVPDEGEMRFPTLTDPVAIARAHAAFVLAWHHLVAKDSVNDATSLEHERLAGIIAGLAPICVDEAELAERARRSFIRLSRDVLPDTLGREGLAVAVWSMSGFGQAPHVRKLGAMANGSQGQAEMNLRSTKTTGTA